jgi:hypothetical protein
MKNSKRILSKQKHEKWLREHGVHPEQIKFLKDNYKKAGRSPMGPIQISHGFTRPAGNIAANGTRSPDNSRIKASSSYTVGVAYNKGPVMVISKDNVQYMGKK